MPHCPGFSTDDEDGSQTRDEGDGSARDEGGRRDGPGRDGSNAESSPPGGRPTRRRTLAAVGTVALGTTAGCLDAVASIGGGNRVEVDPEEPGADPDATPGEFYHHLEEAGIGVDELYHDTDDDDLILFYESDADTRSESDAEIKLVYELFRDELVDPGTDVEHLYTEVVDGFDEQVEGWGVNSQWAEVDLDGQASTRKVGERIEETKVYPDDVSASEGIDEELWGETDGNVIEIGNETDGQNERADRDEVDERNETADSGETEATE